MLCSLHNYGWEGNVYSTEVLERAKILLMSGWAKGAFARDRYGRPVPVLSRDAGTYSVAGAITRAAGGISVESQEALDVYAEVINNSISRWQDLATFEEMMAHLDETLATLRARHWGYE